MKMRLLVILLESLITVYCLSDGEIDKIKTLVDKELIQREADLMVKKKSNNEPINSKVSMEKPPLVTKTTEDPHHALQHSIDNCIDIYDTHKCKVLIHRYKMDCDKAHMGKMCERSCGFCRQHRYPGDCRQMKFGCCKDNVTPKRNPKGTNCPKCKDQIKELCEPHINDCNKVGMVGNWMRANCRKTCEVCTPEEEGAGKAANCFDDKEQKHWCQPWKEFGLCETIPKLMKRHCRYTCGFCGYNNKKKNWY